MDACIGPRISLLLPTRGRPDLARRFLQSVVEQTQSLDNVEVILYVDEDDVSSHSLDDDRISVRRIIGPRTTMGAYLTRCVQCSKGEIVFPVNDDMIIRTPAWDRILLDFHESQQDRIYLAYGDDLFSKVKICTFPILSRRACEILIHPFPEIYRGAFLDYHLLDIFKRLKKMGVDRIIYFKDLILEHVHYRTGRAPFDATYQHRGRFEDDATFIGLRESRQVSARRLLATLENAQRPGPAQINPSQIRPSPIQPGGMIQAVFGYARTFLLDNALPIPWRWYLYVWFCGRYMASKGYLRWLRVREE